MEYYYLKKKKTPHWAERWTFWEICTSSKQPPGSEIGKQGSNAPISQAVYTPVSVLLLSTTDLETRCIHGDLYLPTPQKLAYTKLFKEFRWLKSLFPLLQKYDNVSTIKLNSTYLDKSKRTAISFFNKSAFNSIF